MLETWKWQYIHAPPCKPDSLPTSTNYRLNTSRLSTIKRNEHYLLMHSKYLRVDTIDLFTNYVTRSGSLALVSLRGNHIFYLTHGSEAPKPRK